MDCQEGGNGQEDGALGPHEPLPSSLGPMAFLLVFARTRGCRSHYLMLKPDFRIPWQSNQYYRPVTRGIVRLTAGQCTRNIRGCRSPASS